MTCERAAVLGLGSRIACAEKAMVEDAHFAELGAAPATGVPRNAFSLSVRVAEKGKGRRHKADGNPFGVFDCGLWSAACVHQPPAPTVFILHYCITNVIIFVCRVRDT